MGLTQVEFSKHFDLSASYINLIELGKFLPSIKALRKISRVLNIPYNELLILRAQDQRDLDFKKYKELEKKHPQEAARLLEKYIDVYGDPDKNIPGKSHKKDEDVFLSTPAPYYTWIIDNTMFPFRRGWMLECEHFAEIKDFDLVVVFVKDIEKTESSGELVIKEELFRRIKMHEDTIILHPLNPHYEDTFLKREDIAGCKKVKKIHVIDFDMSDEKTGESYILDDPKYLFADKLEDERIGLIEKETKRSRKRNPQKKK